MKFRSITRSSIWAELHKNENSIAKIQEKKTIPACAEARCLGLCPSRFFTFTSAFMAIKA